MKLQIKFIADKGILSKERVVIKVVADADIGEFLMLRTGLAGEDVTIEVSHTYWFPNKQVATGDLVILYSKAGEVCEKEAANKTRSHFFYWGLDTPIWEEQDRVPVLMHALEWETRFPDNL